MGGRAIQRRVRGRGRRGAQVSDLLLTFSKTRERLAKLADEPRMALTLVMVDGLSYAEAARRLNVSEGVLFSHLAAARQALAAMAAEEAQTRQAAE